MNFDSNEFNTLIGLTKIQVLDRLGNQNNVSKAREWQYDFKNYMLFTKFLVLYFDETDVVKDYKIKFYLNI